MNCLFCNKVITGTEIQIPRMGENGIRHIGAFCSETCAQKDINAHQAGLRYEERWCCDESPGYFQTYPEAIKAILIGLAAMAVFVAVMIFLFKHPLGSFRFFGCASFCLFTVIAYINRGELNVLGKFGAILLSCTLAAMAIVSWTI